MTQIVNAHNSSIACIALNSSGSLLATASDKGTLIRLFRSDTGDRLQELRRGSDKAEIFNLSIDLQSNWIACTSDKGTVHVFSIRNALREQRLQVNEVMELDSSETVVGMARAGIGAGVIPSGRLRSLPQGEVAVLPFGDPPIHRRLVLTERRNNPRSDLSQLVYDAVRRVTVEAA